MKHAYQFTKLKFANHKKLAIRQILIRPNIHKTDTCMRAMYSKCIHVYYTPLLNLTACDGISPLLTEGIGIEQGNY